MPTTPTYPGVYLEELPSGSFSITGVSTSVTAFVGRAPMGPVDSPVSCFSYDDFEAAFGGRDADCPMSYAVEDFFLNGGGEALIVRAHTAASVTAAQTKPAQHRVAGQGGSETPVADGAPEDRSADATGDGARGEGATGEGASNEGRQVSARTGGSPPGRAVAPTGTATIAGLKLEAASPGAWSGRLTAQVDKTGLTTTFAGAKAETQANSFNLTLTYTSPSRQVTVERWTGLTTSTASPRRVDHFLATRSALARAMAPTAAAPFPAAVTAPPATADPVAFSPGSDGDALTPADLIGDQHARSGLYALEHADLFNLLCIPTPAGEDDDALKTLHQQAAAYCAKRRAVYVVDGPSSWTTAANQNQLGNVDPGTTLGITDQAAQQCTAVYFPRILRPDPERGGLVDAFSACGVVAGQIARSDAARGVWKAPAGVSAAMGGVTDLEVNLTDGQQGQLNTVGINCLRSFRVLGPLVWGARTLRGADVMSDDFKYLPVRRLTHYIEESLVRGLKLAVFEPNDETLWSQVRLTVGAFMADLSRQGAFYSYQVACDAKTTTPYQIDRGVCVVKVAFAPVKPAEFIVLQIQQQAGLTAA